MSELVSDVSYKQLKRVSDWQMTQDAQRSALAEMVGAISALDTSLTWGEGKTSASDGQRFLFPQKVIQRTYSPKFSDFALEFYSFVADNYAPYYSTPIECTDRDAPFVLDGILYNESELLLEEHYTAVGLRCPVATLAKAWAIPHNGIAGSAAPGRLHSDQPILQSEPRPRSCIQDGVHPEIHVATTAPKTDPQGHPEGRGIARPGPGRILREARPDKRARNARPSEQL